MALSLKQIAEQTLAGSPITEGREKISTEEIIARYPNGITLCRMDMFTSDDGSKYPVFNFTQDNTKFYGGGALLTRLAEAWLTEAGGDLDAVNAELAAGLTVKLSLAKNKKGQNLTKVTII